jgi:hypothetical protein
MVRGVAAGCSPRAESSLRRVLIADRYRGEIHTETEPGTPKSHFVRLT